MGGEPWERGGSWEWLDSGRLAAAVAVGEESREGGDLVGDLVPTHFRGHLDLSWFGVLFQPVGPPSDFLDTVRAWRVSWLAGGFFSPSRK